MLSSLDRRRIVPLLCLLALALGCAMPAPTGPPAGTSIPASGSVPATGSPTTPASATAVPKPKPVPELSAVVVQLDDLALLDEGTFQVFDEGALGDKEQPPPPRDSPARFGRLTGWKARFRNTDPAHPGVVVVDCRVDLFADASGATAELGAIETEVAARVASGGATEEEAPAIGDGAVAVTYQQASSQGPLIYHEVHWRTGRISASLIVSGYAPGISSEDAAVLARQMQVRLAAGS